VANIKSINEIIEIPKNAYLYNTYIDIYHEKGSKDIKEYIHTHIFPFKDRETLIGPIMRPTLSFNLMKNRVSILR